jgi:small ligand-binding sensory domain FIST
VAEAVSRAGIARAASVLLFLTPQLAPQAAAAVLAAAREAQCTRICGCVAAGIFTEREWVLDAPAAAALVLEERFTAPLGEPPADSGCTLTLVAPDMLRSDWLGPDARRIGAVIGEAHARGLYPLWSMGRLTETRMLSETLAGDVRFVVSPGITPFTPLWHVTAANGSEIASCENRPLWRNLLRLLPHERVKHGAFSLQRLFACISHEPPEIALASGEYEMVAALATNAVDDTVTLARRIEPGTTLFWAIREPQGAESEMRSRLQDVPTSFVPSFALMFSCFGRGPGFYGGHDRDWQLVRERFPGMPFIGLYGAGEIVPGARGSRLLHYASALALVAEAPRHVQS